MNSVMIAQVSAQAAAVWKGAAFTCRQQQRMDARQEAPTASSLCLLRLVMPVTWLGGTGMA